MRILLVEDNRRLSDSLRSILQEEGYAVDAVYDGVDGEEAGMSPGYDVIILDILLPGKNGVEVCKELRNRRITTPILMLTARDALEDRVAALGGSLGDGNHGGLWAGEPTSHQRRRHQGRDRHPA